VAKIPARRQLAAQLPFTACFHARRDQPVLIDERVHGGRGRNIFPVDEKNVRPERAFLHFVPHVAGTFADQQRDFRGGVVHLDGGIHVSFHSGCDAAKKTASLLLRAAPRITMRRVLAFGWRRDAGAGFEPAACRLVPAALNAELPRKKITRIPYSPGEAARKVAPRCVRPGACGRPSAPKNAPRVRGKKAEWA